MEGVEDNLPCPGVSRDEDEGEKRDTKMNGTITTTREDLGDGVEFKPYR
jgi:hypothetical protein